MPKIDSSFMSFKIKDQFPLSLEEERLFFKITRAAFSKRRKTLRNSLAAVIPEENLKIFFDTHSINPNIRPECLSIDDFAKLAKIQSLHSK